jgi:hypothetical protein
MGAAQSSPASSTPSKKKVKSSSKRRSAGGEATDSPSRRRQSKASASTKKSPLLLLTPSRRRGVVYLPKDEGADHASGAPAGSSPPPPPQPQQHSPLFQQPQPASHQHADDDRGAMIQKVVGIKEQELRIPSEAKVYTFEDLRGRRLCWHPARKSAAEFVAGARHQDWRFVPQANARSRRLVVHVPVYQLYYAVKVFRRQSGGWDLRRLLNDIEITLHMAVAHHLRRNYKKHNITKSLVRDKLQGVAICKLLIDKSNVYVELAADPYMPSA